MGETAIKDMGQMFQGYVGKVFENEIINPVFAGRVVFESGDDGD